MLRAFRAGLFAVVAMTGIAQAGIVSSHGALKVKGNKIVNASGNPVQVAGMSLFWSGWMSKYWNTGVVNTLAKDWNSSLIRAAMGVEGTGMYLVARETNKQMVKTIVDAAIANDIYVIIDWHDHDAIAHSSDAVAFFEEMSRLYGKNPHVIFEIFNEPLKVSWSSIKGYAQTVTAAIRKNSDNLILVGTPNWSQDVDAAANDPVSDPNTAYVLHFYAGTHGASLRSKADAALNKGVALFISEWGTTHSDGGTADRTVYTSQSDTWLAWAKERGLSWANWSIADKNESSAALVGGAPSNGGWSDAQLTESGKYVRGKIREVTAALGNGGGTVVVPPPPAKIDTLPVPGRFEAEKASSLSSGIQIESTTDAGGGSALGYTTNGTAEYTVKIDRTGSYTLRARVATAESGTMTFKLNNNQVATLAVENTGGWQSWQTKETQIQLNGTGIAKLQVQWTGAVNLNWLEVASGTAVIPNGASTRSLRVVSDPNGWRVDLPQGARELIVTDLQGRILVREAVSGLQEIQIPGSVGTRLIRVEGVEGPHTTLVAPGR